MSVGVCIVNRNGIALAADSAGTITNNDNKMFYNSMNKVFNLSRKNMLGAITYGKTLIHNTPIEIILKKFRDYIDEENLPIDDVFNVINLLENYLSNNADYYKFTSSERNVCIGLITSLVREWGPKINESIIGVQPDQVEKNVCNVITSFTEKVKESISVTNYDVSNFIKSKYEKNVLDCIKEICPKLVEFESSLNEFVENIYNYFNLYLQVETEEPMGLLIAGYDVKSAYPKYIHVHIYNFVGNKLKYKILDKFDEAGIYSSIFPLAQPDVIDTFCKGISKNYFTALPGIIKFEIDKAFNNLDNLIPKENKDEILKAFSNIQSNVTSTLAAKARKEVTDPLINSLSVLQVPDMAFLAENLVNLTSLKRQFSIDGNQQTVGGPTDVATICQGEGFIWIKRKHYFDKNMNLHYLTKYNKGA
ncbi:MAG: hypothetical protein WC152_05920 [Candidatus Izemoplasmatales bacterium]